MNDYEYDVTLSFAGEDREYVEAVAQELKANGVKVFYDKFEEVDLWGKDLGIHFDFVYRKSAKYCVPFISQYYKSKVWTNHEIRTAIARSIQTNMEYILPARFDETEIDGLRPTLGFIDLRKYNPKEFAQLLTQKVRKDIAVPIVETMQVNHDQFYLGTKGLFNDIRGKIGSLLRVSFTNKIKENRYYNEPFFVLSHKLEDGTDTFYLMDKFKEVTFPQKLEYGQVCTIDYVLHQSSIQLWTKFPKEATVQATVTTTVGEKFKSNTVVLEEIIRIL